MGLVFAITSSCLWILVSIYSIGYMRSLKEHAQTRFYFCFAVALGGAVGQAVGLVLSKYGMGNYNVFAATQIRILAGIIGFAILFFFLKR